MPDSPASVGFNVPFEEAIAAMEARGIALPAQYYGEFQGIQRQLNFSIAGVASLDQLQAVLDSLTAKLADGQSFKQWQDSVAVQDLGLPKHRLDNIYRTNIQNAYNRGHWEQFKENEKYQPYLMYDAINDSRTRPSHRALDGIIRRIDDPFWNTHYPANGYRCRCSVVSLSEKQAQARSNGDNGLNKKIDTSVIKPDKGWDYNCGSDITAGINKAVADKMAKAAAKTVEPKLAKTLKKKIVVPKDDPLHIDKIVAKTPADAPPKPEPKPKDATNPKDVPKLASETPQDHPSAKAWSKEHIDKVQSSFPHKFQDGVFNPDLVKTGNKIKDVKTGETWLINEADGSIVPTTKAVKPAKPKAAKVDKVTKDPIAATWDDESLALMKQTFPESFDKDGNFVNPSKTKPTPTNEQVKKVLGKPTKPAQKEISALDVKQTDPTAKKWSKQKLKAVQDKFPERFEDGIFIESLKTPKDTVADVAKKSIADKAKTEIDAARSVIETKRKVRRNSVDAKIEKGKFISEADQNAIMKRINSVFRISHYWDDDNFTDGIPLARKLGLSEAEHKALYAYTGHTYEHLNAYLGGWADENKLKIPTGVLEEFRNLANQAIAKLPNHVGTVRRDVSLSRDVIDKYVVGEPTVYEQFSSTTTKMDGAFSGNVTYTIETKTGADISGLSKYRREAEVLLPSGVKHLVKEKTKVGNKWLITLVEI